ncbi:MAG: EAL domain-containing protein [bacterium]
MADKQHPSILIVDDCPEDRELYRRLLGKTWVQDIAQVMEAESGAEGLELCQKHLPECILLDYRLQDMDGLEFLSELKQLKRCSESAVVMLTGQGDESIAVEAMRRGVADYLLKSKLDSESLLPAIRNAMKQRKLLLELEKTRRLERELAYHDSLTQLPNRRLFKDRLNHAIAQAKRHRQKVALLNLDLDGFKKVNDSYGHDLGDLLLQSVAKRLKDCVRDCDTVARLGGDEFAIVLENIVQMQDAGKVSEKILKAISKPFVLEAREFMISISIGISVFPNDSMDEETLAKHADTAMYRVKREKKNSFGFYNRTTSVNDLKELQREDRLKYAIENGELVVHYQPQIDVKHNEIIGAEALVRWQHPEQGLLLPAEFISLAEETGLIVPLGEWVLRMACEQSKAWQQSGLPPIRMAVNLSPRQFRVLNIKESITTVLDEFKLDPTDLMLEITETCAMQNVDYAIDTLLSLKEIGVHFSIDDFGTGYASLNYLKRLPFEMIKIDRAFINGVHAYRDDWAIVSTIVSLAHKMHMKVLAEGVENKDQLNYMQSLSCDEIQGFYYSRPITPEAFIELPQKWAVDFQQTSRES